MPWNKAVICLEVLIYECLQMWRHNDAISYNEYLSFYIIRIYRSLGIFIAIFV